MGVPESVTAILVEVGQATLFMRKVPAKMYQPKSPVHNGFDRYMADTCLLQKPYANKASRCHKAAEFTRHMLLCIDKLLSIGSHWEPKLDRISHFVSLVACQQLIASHTPPSRHAWTQGLEEKPASYLGWG